MVPTTDVTLDLFLPFTFPMLAHLQKDVKRISRSPGAAAPVYLFRRSAGVCFRYRRCGLIVGYLKCGLLILLDGSAGDHDSAEHSTAHLTCRSLFDSSGIHLKLFDPDERAPTKIE